jgi:probable blue pigment (indigoidine) exporter
MRDLLLTALAPLAWGTTFLLTTHFLPPNRPLLVATMRALPVGLVLLLYFRRLPEGIWWVRIGILSLLNFGLFFALLFTAAYRLPGGVAATLGALQPFFVAILAWVVLNEHVTGRTFGAAGIGILGVSLIVMSPSARFDGVGVVCATAGALSMAWATVLTRKCGRPVPLMLFTSWQMVFGGFFLLLITLAFEGLPPTVSPVNILGFAYLGTVVTGIAYALWFRGALLLPASMISFLALLSPVSALLLDYIVLGKGLTILQLAGVAFVAAGIILAQHARRKALNDNSAEFHLSVA